MKEDNISSVTEEEKVIIEENLEENVNLEETESDMNDDNIEKLREQARLKAEKQQKKIREKELKSGKKCKIAGIIAAIAGVLEVYFGFSNGSATAMCLGAAFICAGYFYYNLGKRLNKKYHVKKNGE